MARPKQQQPKYELVRVIVRSVTTDELLNTRNMTRDEANQFVVFWRIWSHNPDAYISIE